MHKQVKLRGLVAIAVVSHYCEFATHCLK